MKKIIIAITGATGAVYGVRMLEVLSGTPGVETHLVVSRAARQTIEIEIQKNGGPILALADFRYNVSDVGAAISSGSFRTDGMVVAPCSVKTLTGIAYSRNDNLITRAADVVLKDRRRLVLMVRETPLHLGHLRAMVQVTEMGGIIMPPVPALYFNPKELTEVIDQSVNRALDLLGVELPQDLFARWSGRGPSGAADPDGPPTDPKGVT